MKYVLDAIVTGVYVGAEDTVRSEPTPTIPVDYYGIVGDRHRGRTKKAGVREKFAPKGTEVLNLRQVSIVSSEELSVIAEALEIPEVMPEDLGANICLDLPNLTMVPSGWYFVFPDGATLFITAENTPCVHPGKELQKRYPDVPDLAIKFAGTKSVEGAAEGRRGLVAVVARPGSITVNDKVKIFQP